MQQRLPLLIFLAVLLVYLALSLVFIQVRPINGDEGYYASAARLVVEGQLPYLDFFYPQAPVLPFIYAPAYMIFGSTIVGLRVMSALLGNLALLFWGLCLRRWFPGQWRPVLAGLLLLALNPYFLVWNLTVKTFAAANLAVLVVLWAWEKGRLEDKGRWFFVVGMTLGLLLGVRLLYGPWIAFVLLLCAWWAFGPRRWGGGRLARGHLGFTVVGLLVGLLPTLFFVVRNFDSFVFNNFRYHALRHAPIRSEVDPIGFSERVAATAVIFGKALFLNPFMVFFLVLAVWGTRVLIREKDTRLKPVLIFAAGGFLVHTAASLIPYPVYDQYFTAPLAPLMAPLVLVGLLDLGRKIPGPGVWLGLVLGLALSVTDLAVRHTGMDMAEYWSLKHLAKVTRAIEARTAPDDVVLAFWSGYTFETGRQYMPGMDNHFGIEISERLTQAEKEKYHIPGKELLMGMLVRKELDMIVLGTWMNGINSGFRQEDLPKLLQPLNDNYEVVTRLGEVSLCKRQSGQ